MSEVIVDFEVAGANDSDMVIGPDLIFELYQRVVDGDKAFIDKQLLQESRQERLVEVLTVLRSNQKQQLPRAVVRILNWTRQIIETVNGHLTEHLHIEVNCTRSFWGLCARLYTKLAAHTLSIYINRLLGNPEVLQIKALAFPI